MENWKEAHGDLRMESGKWELGMEQEKGGAVVRRVPSAAESGSMLVQSNRSGLLSVNPVWRQR